MRPPPVLVLALLFGGLTLLFTYPIWLSPASVLNEVADVALNAWILAWDAHALVTDPGGLFDANIFFPHGRTLAFSEHLLGSAILVAPLNWAGQPVLAYNVLFLLSFVLTGIATSLWIRHLTGSTAGGVIGGLIWTFAPAKFDHLAHIQYLTGQWIPAALLCASLYFERARSRYAALCALFVTWQHLSCTYYGLFLLPFLGIYGLLLAIHVRVPSELPMRRVARDLVVASLIVAAVAAPLGLPYLRASVAEGFTRTPEEQQRYSAEPKAFLSASWASKAPHMAALYGRYNAAEANFFPGALPSSLLLLALAWLLPQAWRGRRIGQGPDRVGPAPGAACREGQGLRQGAFRVAMGIAALAGAVHAGGVAAGYWRQGPAALRWVLGLSQATHPALWLAAAAGVAVALWRPRGGGPGRRAPREAVYVVVLSYLLLLTYLLAMGPRLQVVDADLGHGPYALLYPWLLPYRALRVPARFGLLWVLCVAALAGFAVAAALQRCRRGRRGTGRGDRQAGATARGLRARWLAVSGTAVLVALVVLEYRVWPLPAVPAVPRADPVYAWLASQEGDGAVLHLPAQAGGLPWADTEYMLGSTVHWRPLVNGYSAFVPADYSRVARTAPFTDRFYALVRAYFPVEYLVVHPRRFGEGLDPEELAALRADTRHLEYVADLGSTWVFRLRRDWERGRSLVRRYRAGDLEGVRGVRFGARVAAPLRGRRHMLGGSWAGIPLELQPIDEGWRPFAFPVPGGWEPEPAGTATLVLRAHYLRSFGTVHKWLGARIQLVATEDGVRIFLDDRPVAGSGDDGYHLIRLGLRGDALVAWERLPATGDGAARLRRLVERLAPGEVVAVAVRHLRPRVLHPDVRRALAGVGAAESLARPLRNLALVGVAGAPAGSAAESWGEVAVAAVGEEGDPPVIWVRQLEEVR